MQSSASTCFSAAFCVLALACVSCWDQVLAKVRYKDYISQTYFYQVLLHIHCKQLRSQLGIL